ncbi:hypothetical protein [Sphingorhabdus sp. Alg239-R122]|uniref:hypothetical protein n=1 Tax=Sphingorhabdus sp. Alg239-R122 TaxID=2305989 RepID=UPI0013DA15A6|nr:hypothetical protein [Sphingorhabdus sp. Alg239-R122]
MLKLLDNRWVPILAGLFAGLFAIAMAFAFADSLSERALLAARWTARAALPLFLIAYLASSLVRLWPGALTKTILKRRRQWGLGFALAHTIHLGALLVNILLYRPREPETLVAGSLAYAMIYVMALTSNSWSVRKFGKWWRRIHKTGIHYIWFIFTASYAGRIFHEDPGYHPEGRALTAVMLAALAVRITAWWRGSKARQR